MKEVKTDTVAVILYQTARQIHNSRQKQGHKQEVASGTWQPVQSRKIQEYKKTEKDKNYTLTHGDNGLAADWNKTLNKMLRNRTQGIHLQPSRETRKQVRAIKIQ